MVNKPKKAPKKASIKPKTPKKSKETYSIAELWGYTRRDFKRWGKMGGRINKYLSAAERQTAYRRRKAHAKLLITPGILSMKTGRISKYRNSTEKKRAYRLRKKEKELKQGE